MKILCLLTPFVEAQLPLCWDFFCWIPEVYTEGCCDFITIMYTVSTWHDSGCYNKVNFAKVGLIFIVRIYCCNPSLLWEFVLHSFLCSSCAVSKRCNLFQIILVQVLDNVVRKLIILKRGFKRDYTFLFFAI